MAKRGRRTAQAAGVQEAEFYGHPEAESPLRPDVGTQPQFKKKKPPVTYRYDSSLSPALDWDGQNSTRELGEWLIGLIEKAAALKPPHVFDKPQEFLRSDGQVMVTVRSLQEAVEQLKRIGKPFLNWAGKAERLSFDVPTLPLFVHERLSTKAIIDTLTGHRKKGTSEQMTMFDLFGDPQRPVIDQVLRAYEYKDKWVNRMVLGDSLVVMNSLLHYEGLGGQVQMIYMDPPYGVKFGSNFQPFVRKRDVSHNDDEDMTREPEMVKAYRDTWELGLHSYLTYLRDRLLLCRDLLALSGSIFVQISDENLHHVREVMDEVFGAENFSGLIAFRTTGGQSTSLLSTSTDFLLWYAKEKERARSKFHNPTIPKRGGADDGSGQYTFIEPSDGSQDPRPMTKEELDGSQPIPDGWRILAHDTLYSQGAPSDPNETVFEWRGQTFRCPANTHWKPSVKTGGMAQLAAANRLMLVGNTLRYKRYVNDFPVYLIDNVWNDTAISGFGRKKEYVVETSTKVIERCLLMTTDPGDLVIDPTCVRKGTRVFAIRPPCGPPVNGGTGRKEAVNGGTWEKEASNGGTGRKEAVNGGTLNSLPVDGEGQGGVSYLPERKVERGLLPIELLTPGDFVLGHDSNPHRVLRVIRKRHTGTMVGLRHDRSPDILWVTADHRILCRKRTISYGAQRNWQHIPQPHFVRARELRREMTRAEQALWRVLRGRQAGAKFRKQHPIGPYIADFYSWDASLVVEIDGDSHFTPEAQVYDRERDAYLQSLGLTVLRFTNHEVSTQIEAVTEQIAVTLNQAEPSDDHYKHWRRADSLRAGDTVYFGPEIPSPHSGPQVPSPLTGRVREGFLYPVEITRLFYEQTDEEVYDLEVEEVHSFVTEVCTVHNCGSGTTAYVAEQWGRRWITIDTSRVPLALARQRLLTATFPYYELKDESRGPVGGFVYTRKQNNKGEEIGGIVPHITLKSIANNEPPDEEVLVDRPEPDNKITRVSGPFCVEATIPTPVDWDADSVEDSGVVMESHGSFVDRMLEVLRKSPVLHLGGGKTVTLKNVRLPAKTLSLSAEAMVTNPHPNPLPSTGEGEKDKPVAFVFGPENGAVSEKLVYEAAREAHAKSYTHLYVIGFAIQPNARNLVDGCEAVVGIPATYVQATPDLMMGDLLKNMRSSQIFSVCGQPEVVVHKIRPAAISDPVKYQVELLGLDVFDPIMMETDHRAGDDVPAWFLDTEYNGLSFHVSQAFFPRTSAWDNLKRALKATHDESVWDHLAGAKSAPFEAGEHGQVAIKVIDDRGNELLVVKSLAEARP